MAKTTKKAFAGITSKAPTAKKTTLKNPYAKSHQEFIGNPSMQSGKTAKAKADYTKAVKGGAAKAAKKLVKPTVEYRDKWAKHTGIYGMDKVKVVTRNMPKEKATAQRIINDKSKTATRAKIVEMNYIKKTKKKSK
jgi:hypothetical protein